MKQLLYIVISGLAFLLCASANAQTTVYGVNVGYGKSEIVFQDEDPGLVSPLNTDFEDFFQLGLDYMYAPGNSSIYFKSGLLYNARTTENTAIDYIRAPIGFDIGIGNAFQFIFGANVFTSFMLAHTGFENNDDFNENMRRFQFGWGGNLGFGLDVTEKVNINVMYQLNFDLTEIYSSDISTKDGLITENYLGQDGFVRMGLQYRIFTP